MVVEEEEEDDDEEEEEEEEEDLYLSIDPSLLEPDSLARGAIPVLPVPAAIVCCVLNLFLPGSGTIASGFLCFVACCGPGPRFAMPPSDPESWNFENRLCSFLVNLVVGLLQLATVLLCLVGWCWSVGWGIAIVAVAKRNEDFLLERYPLRLRRRDGHGHGNHVGRRGNSVGVGGVGNNNNNNSNSNNSRCGSGIEVQEV